MTIPLTLPSYIQRSPTQTDIPAILDLLHAHDQAVMEEPNVYTADDLLNDWENLDLSSDARVILTPEGILVAYATVIVKPKIGRIVADGYVHPAHTGHGLGTSLIAFTEARAQELLATFSAESRVLLENNVVASSDPARGLLESRQYKLSRVFFMESIDLDGSTPQPAWPAGLSVRTCDGSQEDLHHIHEMIEEGFLDHWEHESRSFEDWQRRRVREHFDPSLWFLVQSGGKIVAAALCQMLEKKSGWVDQLAVLGPWRKQGLGAALLYQAFAVFYQRGATRIGLGVDAQSLTGAQRLYERVGMHITLRIGCYEKELRNGRVLL